MRTKRWSLLSFTLALALLISATVVSAQPAALPSALPTDPVPNPANVLWFPQTSHTLRAAFREYWTTQGGVVRFGYPLTEEFQEQSTDGNTYTVQYFERAKFEWHPQNSSPYNVLLGLLGNIITSGRGIEVGFQPTSAINGQHYFSQTGHNVPEIFYHYWATRGGLAVYGYPISEPIIERSPTDGRFYQVQYFERNRFEYHPELSADYQVSLGLLGTQILKARGWIQ
jgi:hypothetical protein